MLPFLKNPKHRLILAVLVVLGFMALRAYLGGMGGMGGMMYQEQQNTEVVRQDSKLKITNNTNIVQKIQYLKCNDEEVFQTKPADNLVGLNYNQLQKVYAGWTIEGFDATEVDMSLKVDSFCREHANNMFIGTKDGYVTVFYGKPGPKAVVKEVTRIPVERINPQDMEELRQGLVVQSREEMLRTLEGLEAR